MGRYISMILRGGLERRHSRESGNPGGITTGQCSIFLDARLRGHDGIAPIILSEMKQ